MMIYVTLFALLGLFLAGFREGVWTQYTPQDVARWQAEAAQSKLAVQRFLPAPPVQRRSQGAAAQKHMDPAPARQAKPQALELVA
ncbi:hypothetical protein [Hymenobacter rubidus]|uniref:hypothetical protein n=1 Tax=Hymenobacter rubidus TaxID=1441626 RepID=UPI0019200096|nr:hypothetical protein [Hymenobacter rubidus]